MAVARYPKQKKKRRALRARWWLMGLVVLVAAVGGFTYWRTRSTGVPAQQAAGPQTLTVSPEPYQLTIVGPGILEAASSFEVGTDVAGTVQSLIAVGERVTAGQVIGQLDPVPFERAVRDAQLALEKAQADLTSLNSNQADSYASLQESIANAERNVASAQREVTRTAEALELATRLHAIGSESAEAVAAAKDAHDSAVASLASAQTSLDTLRQSQNYQSTSNAQALRNAEIAVAQAELALADAQEDLEETTLTAPIDGVVSAVNVQIGTRVSENTALINLIDDSTVELPAQIDETDIGQVAVEQAVEVTLDAIPDRTFVGEVTAIAPVARNESNIPIFDVTVTLDNPQRLMRPGMTAEAQIIVQEFESAVSLPSGAVQTMRDQSFIRVRQPDGSFAPQPVTVVDTVGFNTIVAAALEPGTVVLVPAEATQVTRPSEAQRSMGGPVVVPAIGGGPVRGGGPVIRGPGP